MEGNPWWNGHLVVLTQAEANWSDPSRIAVLALGDNDAAPGGNDGVRDAVLEPIGIASREVDESSHLHVWGGTSGWHELFVATEADLIAAGVVAVLHKLLKQARAGHSHSRSLSREDAEARVALFLSRVYKDHPVRVASTTEADGVWGFRAEVAGKVIEGTIDATGALLVADCHTPD